ncbi:MAG: ClbS/DfsB family four-helix bundle protein [Anaerolineae bacterium]|nr:ClbS/DfsB family four-helix bundle protein [Anaerolineae bacterium]
MTDEYPHSKAELLENLKTGWQTLDTAIKQYNEAQLTQLKDHEGWTVKDHLSHFVAWASSIGAFLEKRPRWEGMGIDRATWDAHYEAVNAAVQKRDIDRPLADVLAELKAVHDQIVAKVTALPEEDLFKPYFYFQPFEPDDATDQRPAVIWIISNTYEHYAEHLPWIEAIVAAQPPA